MNTNCTTNKFIERDQCGNSVIRFEKGSLKIADKPKEGRCDTHQPFLMALEAFLVKPLNSDDHARPRLGSCECILINPSLEDTAKATFTQHTIRAEVPGGSSKFTEAKALQIGGLQDLAFGSRSRRHRGRRDLAT